jgi:hypothetical protein
MTRTVKIFSTKGNSASTIQSEAKNWGELKADFDANGIEYQNMQVVVKETKAILAIDDATLPTGVSQDGEVLKDITIYLAPKQIKAGIYIDYNDFNVYELKGIVKYLRVVEDDADDFFDDYSLETHDDYVDALEDWDETNSLDDDARVDEAVDLIFDQSTLSKIEIAKDLLENISFDVIRLGNNQPTTQTVELSEEAKAMKADAEAIFSQING